MLNFIAPHLLAPLFGVPSGLYGLHHVIMHHTVGAQAFTLSDARPCQDACPKTPWSLMTRPYGPGGQPQVGFVLNRALPA